MNLTREKILYSGIIVLIINFYFKFSHILNYGEIFDKITLFLGLGLLILNFVLKKEKQYTVIKIILIIAGLLNYYISKQSDVFQLIVLLVSLHGEDVKGILKFSLKINFTMVLLHIMLFFLLLVISPSLINYTYRYVNGGVIIRYNFLFLHANLFAALIAWIYLAYLYCYGDISNKNNFIFFLIVFFLAFFLAKSRTSGIIILTTYLLYTFYNNFSDITKKILKIIPFVIVIISVLLLVFYDDNNISGYVDSMLEHRIKLGYVIGKKYGYHLKPNYVDFAEKDSFYWKYGLSGNGITIDSTYYKMIFCNGIIFFFVFVVYILKGTKRINYKDKTNIFLIAYFLFLMVESFGYYALVAFPVLLIGGKNEKSIDYSSNV